MRLPCTTADMRSHISCCALVFQLLCMRRTAVVRLFNGNSIDCLC